VKGDGSLDSVNPADTGDITFDGVKIIGAGTASGDGQSYSTMELVPDSDLYANDQYLIIDPTTPNHIHIRAGGTQDDSDGELMLGGERNQVRVSDNYREVSISTRPATISNNYVNDNMTSSTTFVTSNSADISIDYVVNVEGTDYIVNATTNNSPSEGLLSVTASGAQFTAGNTYTFTYEPTWNYYWEFGSDGVLSGPGMGNVIVPGISGTENNDLSLFSNLDIKLYTGQAYNVPVGYRYTPQRIITSTGNVTAGMGDMGFQVYNKSGDGAQYIVPLDSTVNFPIGTEIKFANDGDSYWTFDREDEAMTLIAEGQNYTNSNIVFWLPSNGLATLVKVDANRWILSGIRVND
jgi:hypothetical protein